MRNLQYQFPRAFTPYKSRVTPFSGRIKTTVLSSRITVKTYKSKRHYKYEEDKLTLLRLDKLFGNYSIIEKVIWFLLLTTSFILCIWQVYVCVNRFVKEPIGRHTKIAEEIVYTLPYVTLCPASPIFGFYFDLPFEKKCNQDVICSKLNVSQRKDYPITKLNVNLMDLWVSNEIKSLKVETRCGFLKNVSECPTNTTEWPSASESSVDTVSGRCRLIGTELEWFYSGKTTWPWVIEDIVMDISMIKFSHYFLDNSISNIKSTELLFMGHQAFKTNTINRLEFTITKFESVYSSRHPCSTEKRQIDCQIKCIYDKAMSATSKIKCTWPFLKIDLPYCNTLNEIEKFRRQMLKIRSELSECDCPRPCKFVRHTSSVTYYDSIGNKTKIGIIPFSKTMLIVKEYFSYPVSSLVADLGGSIGLFLGLSLVSIFEFLNTLIKKLVSSK